MAILKDGEYVIGRGKDIALPLNDSMASRKHCKVNKFGDDFHLEDLNSQNGTFLNGTLVAGPAKLKSGDQVSFGNSKLLVEIRPSPSSPIIPAPRPEPPSAEA